MGVSRTPVGGWAPTHCSQLHLPGGTSRLSRGVPGVWGGERRAGGSLPAVLDGTQISAPPVPLWAHLELDQRKNSMAGGAEPGLTPNKPAPHCPALPSKNHSQGPLPAPAHHALRLRAGGSLMPPEAPECPPSNWSSVCPLPPPPHPHQERRALGIQQGSWQLPELLQRISSSGCYVCPDTGPPKRGLRSCRVTPQGPSRVLRF